LLLKLKAKNAPFTAYFGDVIFFSYNGGNTLMKRSILLKITTCAAISLTLSSIGYSELKAEARYPTEVINRPSVMPTEMVGINLDTGVEKLRTVNLGLRTEFGLVENLEGRFGWDGFGIDTKAQGKSKLNIKRTVNLGLKYNYLSVPHVSLSATLKVPLHIFDGEILREVTVGPPVVFYNRTMAGGILNDLFTLTMREHVAARFDFKWWYGVQVYGNLWADINSSFGHIELNNPKNVASVQAKGFWHELPVGLGLVYAFNNYFDLGANAGFDNALDAKNTFNFGLTFTARAGRLFG